MNPLPGQSKSPIFEEIFAGRERFGGGVVNLAVLACVLGQ